MKVWNLFDYVNFILIICFKVLYNLLIQYKSMIIKTKVVELK